VAEVTVRLEPWLRLRERGWVNGDAHAHLYTDTDRDQAMLATVRRICRAQGVDFLCAAQTLVAYGLRRYGRHDLALELTRRLRALVEARGIAEHYDSRTGDPLGVPGLGMSSTVWSAIVENEYGVRDDFRTVRVPPGAAGRWLRLGKLEVAYPSDRAVEIRTGFDREMTVAFADGSAGGPPRVACGGRRIRPRLEGGGISFRARPGETCRVER
jgi:hypothetical protein